MNEIKDFKNIADEAMCDLYVTETMKNEVLKRAAARGLAQAGGTVGLRAGAKAGRPSVTTPEAKVGTTPEAKVGTTAGTQAESRMGTRAGTPVGTRASLLRLAALAACGVLIFGIMHLGGILKPNGSDMSQDDQSNIFSATANQPKSINEPPEVGILNEPTALEWQPESIEEASRSFGEGFLIPSYLPEGFRPVDINATGDDMGKADRIVLNYTDGEGWFTIIEERAIDAGGFSGFETIDINGTTGYMKPENQKSDVEVYWFKQGVQYSVSGLIEQEQAIKTARSMELTRQ